MAKKTKMKKVATPVAKKNAAVVSGKPSPAAKKSRSAAKPPARTQKLAAARKAAPALKGHKTAAPPKDVAHRTRSAWLAACWLNYRNLYLASAHGRGWAQKYLKSVTPTQVKFSSFPAAEAPQGVAR